MIRIYIRYSYGGYKNFLVNGRKDELLNQISTVNNTLNLPDEAVLLLNRGHSKIIYLQLLNNELSLLIKGIPSPHTDSDGRNIPFEILFIGSNSDRTQMDNLSIAIANDIDIFEKFLYSLFFERQGLYIQGDLLREYIEKHKNITFQGNSPLLDIKKNDITSRVLFFVPLSPNFNVNKDATSRVLYDLELKSRDVRHSLIIPYQTLNSIKKMLCEHVHSDKDLRDSSNVITIKSSESTPSITKETPISDNSIKDSLFEISKNISQIQKDIAKLSIISPTATTDLPIIERRNSTQSNRITINEKTLLLLFLILLFGLLIIFITILIK